MSFTRHADRSIVYMPSFARRIGFLKFLGRKGRVEVLGAAIRAAADWEVPVIADEMLGIAASWPEGLALPHVIARYGALKPTQQDEARRLVLGEWAPLSSFMLKDAAPTARAGVLQAMGAVPVVAMAKVMASSLSDKDTTVGDVAEKALEEVFRVAQLSPASVSSTEQSAVAEAAEMCIEGFDTHRRTGILRAAINATVAFGASNGLRRMKWAGDEQHPAQMVMRGLIRKSDDPSMRACAWTWLKHGALSSACLERLTRATSPADHAAVLERTHLLLNPARLQRLTPGPRVDGDAFVNTLPRLNQIEHLSLASRRGLPAWIAAAPVTERLKDAASAVLLVDTDPSVRHALAREAINRPTPPSCLLDVMFDPDERVASTAADAVLSRSASHSIPASQAEHLAETIERSPHERVRALSRQLGMRSRRDTSINSTPETLVTIATSVGLNNVSPRRAASAVTELAKLPTPMFGVVEALTKCLDAGDARVRANAVDGLTRRARTAVVAPNDQQRIIEVFLDRATDGHHRIRANAVRGLFVAGLIEAKPESAKTLTNAGSRTLSALLADARVMHRVAGLWLTERMAGLLTNEADVLDRVNHVADRAIDPLERAWASRAKGRLEHEVRVVWAGRAADFDGTVAMVGGPGGESGNGSEAAA